MFNRRRDDLQRRNESLVRREQQLLRVSRSAVVDAGDLQETFRLVCSAACIGLQVQRSSIWFWDDAHDAIVCRLLLDGSQTQDEGFSSTPTRLARSDFPHYFAALDAGRALLADDAHTHPGTAEFSATYLRPLGIASMLDVAIRHRGEIVGALCCEHTGTARHWQEDEAFFAAALADLVARGLSAQQRSAAEASLRELNASLEQRIEQRTLEAQQARTAAELARRQLIEITDNVPSVVFEFHRSDAGEYRFPFANHRIIDLLGVSREAVMADASVAFNAVLADDLPGMLAEIERSARELTEWNYSWRVQRVGDGSVRWLQGRSTPMRVADGVLWRGVMTDLTEQKQLATDLQSAKELAEMMRRWVVDISDTAPGFIFEFIRDAKDHYSAPFVSGGIDELVGLSADAVVDDVGRYFATVLPEDAAAYLAIIENSAVTGAEVRHRFRLRHARSDDIRWMLVHAKPPTRLADGSSLWRGHVSDVTEQKQLEEDLAAQREAAQAASRAKSVFLATMSHEIRTPMTGVIGMLEVLAHSRLDPAQQRTIDIIRQSADSLQQIIGDILDFSKIEAGKLTLAPVNVSLRDLVANASNAFLGAASAKGLALEHSVDERIAAAHLADPLPLRQILGNFLSNAVKFTEQGGVTLELRVIDSTADTQTLRFAVRDTGIGISPAAQQRLFEPFQQGEDHTSRRYGGTGLGLTICRRLAELMNASISIDSREGHGTTMQLNITLPLGDASAIEPRTTATPAGAQTRIKPSRAQAEAENSVLLLAEDHPVNRLVLSSQFELAGFHVDIAEDGAQALERWRTSRYGMVFTDCHMPNMDGYQLAQAIRHEEAAANRARTPIVGITASVLQSEAEKCYAAGMDDYLSKPVSIPQLLDRLRRWLPALDWSSANAAQAAELPPASPRVVALLDPAVLHEIIGDDADMQQRILADFCRSARADCGALAQSLQTDNRKQARRDAHRLAGSSSMVGATELASLAQQLEAGCESLSAEALRERLAGIEAALQRLMAEIGIAA